MTDQKTKLYLKFLRKNQRLFHAVLGKRISDKKKNDIALSIAEIHFSSRRLTELTKRISQTRPSTEEDLDSLLEDLCGLQAEVYDTMANYAKILKKPLKTSIDKIAHIVSDDPDAAIATKTIHVAKQHIDMLMNKIEAYPEPVDPKQEAES